MDIIQPFILTIPKVDTWVCNPEDMLFTSTKNTIIAPISSCLGITSDNIDYFIIRPKKCYNSQDLRDHLCQVLNYFEKYFDQDRELFIYLARIKFMIDNVQGYDYSNFIHDMRTYVLGDSIKTKVVQMTEYNYNLDLTYKNISESLQYTNDHAKMLLEISILMDCAIPLTIHFAHVNRITEIDEFILDVYDIILQRFPAADIFSKLYTTSYSNVSKSEYKNAILWAKQDVRGKDVATHSLESVNNIILNIMPKYAFDKNIVALNYTSVIKNTKCQITDIGYEYNFVPLSSSKRDAEDSTSEFDKYEAGLIRSNEALYLQNKINSSETMKIIESQFGPFDEKEIEFYRENLKNDSGSFINNFQKQLIFNIFYKYFGDVESVYAIVPATDYIKLMIAAKKLLLDNYMIILPYVISGKVEKLVPRKTINKKEDKDLKSSQFYPMLMDKYRSEKVMQQILSTFATVISSTFRVIDYNDPNMHGKIIDCIPSIVLEELCILTMLY